MACGISRNREAPVVGLHGGRLSVASALRVSPELVGAIRGAHLIAASLNDLRAHTVVPHRTRLVVCAPQRVLDGDDRSAVAERMSALDRGWQDMPRALAAHLESELGTDPGVGDPACLFGAQSTAARGVAVAARMLEETDVDAVLLVAVDSYCDAATLEWLDEKERLKTPDTATGFVPGEAGVCLLLGRPTGRPNEVEIRGAAQHTERRSPSNAEALTKALDESLRGLTYRPSRPLPLFTDMNGERARSREVAFAMTRLGARFQAGLDLHHPASAVGDVGAATGALLVALAGEHLRLNPEVGGAVVATADDDGTRATVALSRQEAN